MIEAAKPSPELLARCVARLLQRAEDDECERFFEQLTILTGRHDLVLLFKELIPPAMIEAAKPSPELLARCVARLLQRAEDDECERFFEQLTILTGRHDLVLLFKELIPHDRPGFGVFGEWA